MKTKPRRAHGTGSLYPVVGPGGRETWYGRWYIGRKRVQRRIGPKRRRGDAAGLTKTEAEAELRRMRLATEETPPPETTVTVDEAARHLMRHLEAIGRRPTTLATYRSLFRSHLQWSAEEVDLERFTRRDVEELDRVMRRKALAPKTRLNALKLLSEIFAFAKRQGWCRRNPCEQVQYPRVEPTTDIRFLTEVELVALLKAVNIEEEPLGHTDRAMFLTAALTGLRQSELLGLEWRDVDFAAERIRVRRTNVRGHRGPPKSRYGSRSVPMAPQVAAALRRYLDRSRHRDRQDLVFGHPLTGKVLSYSAIDQRFKKALRAAKVREVRFEDLRHTFGTRLAAEGVPIRDIQEWMGHEDIRTTQIYAAYEPRKHEAKVAGESFSEVKLDP
ncbi:MAG TPA: site-specific integrase [Solirubrobacterales bacterium]|nr:site-specific integrase [Solirubrobacterales bacterium]